MKLLLEKIPQCRLGGEKIDCRYANRHNLSVFEDKANDRMNTLQIRFRTVVKMVIVSHESNVFHRNTTTCRFR